MNRCRETALAIAALALAAGCTHDWDKYDVDEAQAVSAECQLVCGEKANRCPGTDMAACQEECANFFAACGDEGGVALESCLGGLGCSDPFSACSVLCN
jgi:hypothetical protein